MKTTKLLSLLLVLSVSVNLFVYFTSMIPATEINSYASPATVSEQDAERDINAYSAENEGTAGGIITGSTFSQIFSNENANAVSYRLAADPSGNIYIVLEGANVVMEEGQIKSAVKAGSGLYRANNWCPPNCVSITRE
jgi:hypothetical protein